MTDDIKDILKDIDTLIDVYGNPQHRANLLARITCAIEAQRGLDKPADTGPWVASADGRIISSDDFEHDVQLKVGGDFYSDEQRAAYSRGLARRLNGLPKEPPPGLLTSMAMRLRHDFGLNADDFDGPIAIGVTEREREIILADMRRVYDEVTGNGFFKWQD